MLCCFAAGTLRCQGVHRERGALFCDHSTTRVAVKMCNAMFFPAVHFVLVRLCFCRDQNTCWWNIIVMPIALPCAVFSPCRDILRSLFVSRVLQDKLRKCAHRGRRDKRRSAKLLQATFPWLSSKDEDLSSSKARCGAKRRRTEVAYVGTAVIKQRCIAAIAQFFCAFACTHDSACHSH